MKQKIKNKLTDIVGKQNKTKQLTIHVGCIDEKIRRQFCQQLMRLLLDPAGLSWNCGTIIERS